MARLERARINARPQDRGSTQSQSNGESRTQHAARILKDGQAALLRGQVVQAREAIAALRDCLPLDGGLACGFAELALHLGQPDDCVEVLEGLTTPLSAVPVAASLLGRGYLRKGRPQQAIRWLEQGLSANAADAHLWHDLATAYLQTGALDAAILGYREVVQRAPAAGEAHHNLGTALLHAGRYEEAVESFCEAVQLNPAHAQAHLNLGIALKAAGRPEAGLQSLKKAQKILPSDPEVSWNLALTEILLGNLCDGFKHFEARLRIKGQKLANRQTWQTWQGQDLGQEPLVVLSEQGLGDTLQFLRFLPHAANRCGDLTLVCRPELVPLLQQCYRGPANIQGDEQLPYDAPATVPLMSLPHRLGLTAELTAAAAYLHADETKVAHYRQLLPSGRLRIGLCWQGNPAYREDKQRSMPFRYFAPLWRLADTQFISLQRGAGAEQQRNATVDLVDWGNIDPEGAAFTETVHALSALDLLITTDTAIAHLAGAIGMPVWLLLAHMPDFRWGLTGSRWYRSMRVFRQPRPGDWAAVVDTLYAELATLDRGRALP